MITKLDRQIGMFLGLAVGDALGVTLEFGPGRSPNNLHTEMIGGGMFELEPGEWSDDTAMAIAMATSLLKGYGFNPFFLMDEWAAWYQTGKYSCNGRCFDIGFSTQRALDSWIEDPIKLPVIASDSLGNGSLMRLAPMVLFSNENNVVINAKRQAALTLSFAK